MSTASAPAAAIRFGRGATPNRSASGTAARQPQLSAQLSVRDRQRHHLLTQWVEQLRDQGDAGGVHAAKVHHNGSRTTFEIIFDDGRRRASPGDPGTAAPQLGTPPSMPAPHRQAFSNPQKKPTARERVRAGGDGRPPAAAANPQRQMEYDPEMLPAEDPFLRWVATMPKKEAKEIERGVKAVITDIVRSEGGSAQTGGRLLEPALEKLQFGDHPIRALRLPTHSASTQMTSSELEVKILEIWWNNSDDSEQGARRLRALLTPKER